MCASRSLDSLWRLADAGLLMRHLGTLAKLAGRTTWPPIQKNGSWPISIIRRYTKTSHTSSAEMDLAVAIREKLASDTGTKQGRPHRHSQSGTNVATLKYPWHLCQPAARRELQRRNPYRYREYSEYHATMVRPIPAPCLQFGQIQSSGVYIVSGARRGRKVQRPAILQNCMHYSNPTNGGCFILSGQQNRLDAEFFLMPRRQHPGATSSPIQRRKENRPTMW